MFCKFLVTIDISRVDVLASVRKLFIKYLCYAKRQKVLKFVQVPFRFGQLVGAKMARDKKVLRFLWNHFKSLTIIIRKTSGTQQVVLTDLGWGGGRGSKGKRKRNKIRETKRETRKKVEAFKVKFQI